MDSQSVLMNLHDNIKLDQTDQQQIIIRSNEADGSTNQRSSSNSSESDVDSGIVAIEHNLSRISSGQLPISCDLINRFQLEANLDHQQQINSSQQSQLINHQLTQSHQYHLSTNNQLNQINHLFNQIDYQSRSIDHLNDHSNNQLVNNYLNNHQSTLLNQFNNDHLSHSINHSINHPLNHSQNNFNILEQTNQLHHSLSSSFLQKDYNISNRNRVQPTLNYLTSIKENVDRLESSDELNSELIRNSCRKVLAKLNSSSSVRQSSNDVIYANVNATINHQSSRITSATSLPSNEQSKCVQDSIANQYAVPMLINCDCLNCEQIKKEKLATSLSQATFNNNSSDCANLNTLASSLPNNNSIIHNQQIRSISQRSIQPSSQLNEPQLTQQERRVNQEDIKQLLLEALRQKNLEKELLEEKEHQLKMYLQERHKMINKENETMQGLSKLNLNNDTCDLSSSVQVNGDCQTTSVQYENTSTVFKRPAPQTRPHQPYQNVPFHQSTKLNSNLIEPNNNKRKDFTKSCIVKPTETAENSIDDELIAKSFNGGYCSQQTRKILEGSNFGNNNKVNFKKSESKSFLQKFSFKFSKAFTKAFFIDNKSEQSAEIDHKQSIENKIPKTEIEQQQTVTSIERTSNFIEKIKSIDTSRSIQETNNKLKNKSIECSDALDSTLESTLESKVSNISKQNNNNSNATTRHKSTTKPENRRFEINLDEYCIIKKPELTPKKYSSIDEEKKRGTIKKRNSINRKSCLNKQQCSNALTNSKSRSSHRHHKSSSKCKIEQCKDQCKESSKDERVIAELIEIHKNGTQVIEIKRVPNRHFGFYFARGKVKNVNGVYVSRMRDEETKNLLTGLLEVGDQIISIDGVNCQDSSIIEVNYLMTNKNTIKLHVKPYTKS